MMSTRLRHCCHSQIFVQNALVASVGTLREVHNVSMPPPPSHCRPRPTQPPTGLERFCALRAVTVTEAHHARDSCLPALPASVRTLTLDAGRGTMRCGCSGIRSHIVQRCQSPSWA